MAHRIKELQCIMPVENIASVMKYGILSFEKVSKLPHQSVAMDEVQERRSKITVPNGLKLHRYANLYFCARNPMLFVRKDRNDVLCILRVDKDVLNLPDVVVTDMNASSGYVVFYPSPAGIRRINFDLVYAEYWRDSNQIQYFRKKSAKCAEILVPGVVPVQYIIGAYVCSLEVKNLLYSKGFLLPIIVDPQMFFLTENGK